MRCYANKGYMSQVSPTDCHWLDSDSLFNVCVGSIVRILVLENLLPAESVDKCSTTCRIIPLLDVELMAIR
jgi:hypothetical protein